MDLEVCFQELNVIDRSDWHNIPQPLIKSLKTIKKCLLSLQSGLKENIEESLSISKSASTQINSFESEIASIQKQVASSEINIKKQVKELTEKIKENKIVLQTNLSTELEYMKKTYDGKLLYFDTQLKSALNNFKSLPKFEDVEKMIRDFVHEASKNLEIQIKGDIKLDFIDPEVGKIEKKFEAVKEFEEDLNRYGIVRKLEKTKEEFGQKNQGLKEEFEEKVMNLTENVDDVAKAVEKNASNIESLGLKLNQRINESIKKTQNQVDTCIFNLNNSQEKLQKPIKELQSNQERLFDEINSIRDSMTPASPGLVYQPSIQSIDSPKSSKIKPKKVPRAIEQSQEHPRSSEFLNQLKSELSAMQSDFKHLKSELELSILNNEAKSQDTMSKLSEFVDDSVTRMRIEVSDSLLELREKLKWLPMNLKDIKGMSPNDARIFIIEARIRSEENSRIDQFNKITNMLDCLKAELKNNSENLANTTKLPSLQYSRACSQTPDIMYKDTLREASQTFRNSPTPDRIKIQLPRNIKISMSVDINKTKRKRQGINLL